MLSGGAGPGIGGAIARVETQPAAGVDLRRDWFTISMPSGATPTSRPAEPQAPQDRQQAAARHARSESHCAPGHSTEL